MAAATTANAGQQTASLPVSSAANAPQLANEERGITAQPVARVGDTQASQPHGADPTSSGVQASAVTRAAGAASAQTQAAPKLPTASAQTQADHSTGRQVVVPAQPSQAAADESRAQEWAPAISEHPAAAFPRVAALPQGTQTGMVAQPFSVRECLGSTSAACQFDTEDQHVQPMSRKGNHHGKHLTGSSAELQAEDPGTSQMSQRSPLDTEPVELRGTTSSSLQLAAQEDMEEARLAASDSGSDSGLEREILSTLGELLHDVRTAARTQSTGAHQELQAVQQSDVIAPAGEHSSLH